MSDRLPATDRMHALKLWVFTMWIVLDQPNVEICNLIFRQSWNFSVADSSEGNLDDTHTEFGVSLDGRPDDRPARIVSMFDQKPHSGFSKLSRGCITLQGQGQPRFDKCSRFAHPVIQ